MTYRQLEHCSDELACWLVRRSLAAETLVGVLATRSCLTIVAFVGILKANLAYLPLDVSNPADRTERLLSSIGGHKLVLLGSDCCEAISNDLIPSHSSHPFSGVVHTSMH